MHPAALNIECESYTKQQAESIKYVRIESDLDSIEVSIGSNRKLKLYFNSREDKKEDIEARILEMAEYANIAEDALKK